MRRALALSLLLVTVSTASAEIFTWTDRGIRHYTNSIHEVPARFRSRVKVLDVPTGKKLNPTAAQLAGQTQPDQPGGQSAAAAAPAPTLPAPVPVATPAPAGTATAAAPAPAPAAQAAPTRVPAVPYPVSTPTAAQQARRARHHPPGGSREE
ncbi:hypothetical protein [Geomesophilobacter sediminis]|uniref:DUF4124 domain-containing protein n=1 Tax=Geomesophilobacter sediminis TaxID=2798584 RepID=A0A8J7JF48_9BACT|nr:hypothetical protein [Geomesophilobacter sediminis]MBJ6726473.1 hypothetical protein [Geomesophilobacter sediminis]